MLIAAPPCCSFILSLSMDIIPLLQKLLTLLLHYLSRLLQVSWLQRALFHQRAVKQAELRLAVRTAYMDMRRLVLVGEEKEP